MCDAADRILGNLQTERMLWSMPRASAAVHIARINARKPNRPLIGIERAIGLLPVSDVSVSRNRLETDKSAMSTTPEELFVDGQRPVLARCVRFICAFCSAVSVRSAERIYCWSPGDTSGSVARRLRFSTEFSNRSTGTTGQSNLARRSSPMLVQSQ
jgi:hypothetical protein